MPALSVKLGERFWRKVDKTDGCWNWTASDNGVGYGMFWYPERQKRMLAHRLSYESAKGAIPDGLFIMHLCDNPRCVNPDHLQAGTHSENMRDCVSKGRHKIPHFRGEENHASKHTETQVREALRLRREGIKRKEIVRLTGVTVTTLKDINRGRSWAYLANGGCHQ